MRRVPSLRALTAGLVLASLSLVAPPLAASAAPVAMRMVAPAVAVPVGDRVIGAMPSDQRISFGIYLAPRDASGLSSYAATVTDPRSASYRHYLARGEFARRFAARAATVASVASVLRARGLAVSAVAADGLRLGVTATVSTIERALSTRIDRFRLADGTLGSGVVSPVMVPASISGDVLGVVGLNDLVREHSSLLDHLRRPVAGVTGRRFPTAHLVPGAPDACSQAVNATAQGAGGVTDTQVANAYGANGLYAAGDFASGQDVAVFELEPFALSDVAQFEQCYFGHSNAANISTVNVDGGPGAGTGSGESALDIENVAALAPAAHISVYQAPNNTFGALDAYGRIVADDAAKVVTTSWGLCESLALAVSPAQLAVEHVLFEQAAAQGQTVVASAGDSGSTDCLRAGGSRATTTIDDPSGQPYVVSVGGTTAVSTSNPPQEQVWNDGMLGGSTGGGPSSLWPIPSWQRNLATVTSAAPRAKCGASGTVQCRVTPDVSAFADEMTGITIYFAGQWGTIGGTSSSAPIWASMLAEVNASSTCASSPVTAGGVGFASPLLYEVGSSPAQYAASFNDVTLGNNDSLNYFGGLYTARAGYDAASGLGSPDLFGTANDGLAYNLCHDAREATTSSLTSVVPRSGTIAGGTAVTITGAGFETGLTSNVKAVNFGELPAASFTVTSPTTIRATTPPAALPRPFGTRLVTGSDTLVNVTYVSGHVAVGPTFAFKYVSHLKLVPTILQVGPTGGPNSGGNAVTIYGSGFTGATSVTFGGVHAAGYVVKSDSMIVATAPAEGAAACLAASHTFASGLCQSQVVVTANGASSPVVPIRKPLSGSINYNDLGVPIASATCGCEALPTLTEYDFQRAATITTVKDAFGASLQNSQGFDPIVATGTGFNILTFEYAGVGDPTQAANQQLFPIKITNTAVTFLSPPDPSPSSAGDSAPVVVVSLGGTSTTGHLAYGPVPIVNSISSKVLPTAGGLALTIHGAGFTRVQMIAMQSLSSGPPTPIFKDFLVVDSHTITLLSPSLAPGAYLVDVINAYGESITYVIPPPGYPSAPYESQSISSNEVVAAYPGAPVIASTSGIATCSVVGGCSMTLVGANLGYPSDPAVYVGTQPATVTNFTSVAGVDTLTITIPPSWLSLTGLAPVYVFATTGFATSVYEAAVNYE